MAYLNTKAKALTVRFLLFAFLTVFPFGQLVSYDLHIAGYGLTVNLLDLVTVVIFIFVLLKGVSVPGVYKNLWPLTAAAIFPLLLSLSKLPASEVAVGFLYLYRLILYSTVFVISSDFISQHKNFPKLLADSLLAVAFFIALFGWVQYLWLPDLRTLVLIGWDDHLYRLAGTFLDPAFTGILVTFGFIAALFKYSRRKSAVFLFLAAFFAVTVLFTYSRASYLALTAGLFYFLRKKYLIFVSLILLVSTSAVIFLPKKATEASRFLRLHSVNAKFQNYRETVGVFSLNPVFGTGFNTICSYRVRMFGDSFASHSCYGSDSSLLLVLATTGIVGFIIALRFIKEFIPRVGGPYKDLFLASVAALFVHSLFVNSVFYPWVFGWIAILSALAVRGKIRDGK